MVHAAVYHFQWHATCVNSGKSTHSHTHTQTKCSTMVLLARIYLLGLNKSRRDLCCYHTRCGRVPRTHSVIIIIIITVTVINESCLWASMIPYLHWIAAMSKAMFARKPSVVPGAVIPSHSEWQGSNEEKSPVDSILSFHNCERLIWFTRPLTKIRLPNDLYLFQSFVWCNPPMTYRQGHCVI